MAAGARDEGTRTQVRRAACGAVAIALALVGCSTPDLEPPAFGAAESPLQGGSVDLSDRAVVGIVAQRAVGRQTCSGTLIAPNVVVTARHCVAETFPDVVRCGQAAIGPPVPAAAVDVTTTLTTDNSLPDDAGAHHGVREIRLAPGGDDACGFDLALLVLADVVDPSEASPLAPRFDPQIANNEAYSAVGFGSTCSITSGKEECYLQSGTRRRVDGLRVRCAERCPDWSYAATEWQGGDALCEGDSGGPAIDTAGRVIGIGSRGSSDADGNCTDGVYVRIASWRGLLMAAVLDAAGAAGVEPPEWAVADAASGEGEGPMDGSDPDASLGGDADGAAEADADCGELCAPRVLSEVVLGGGCSVAGGVAERSAGGWASCLLAVVIACARRTRWVHTARRLAALRVEHVGPQS
jgi:hypothetical protein